MQSCELGRHVEVPEGFKPLNPTTSLPRLNQPSSLFSGNKSFIVCKFGTLVHGQGRIWRGGCIQLFMLKDNSTACVISSMLFYLNPPQLTYMPAIFNELKCSTTKNNHLMAQ